MLSFTHVLKKRTAFILCGCSFSICVKDITLWSWNFIFVFVFNIFCMIRRLLSWIGILYISFAKSQLFLYVRSHSYVAGSDMIDPSFSVFWTQTSFFFFDIICKTCEDDYVLHDTSVFLPFFRFIFRPFLDNKMFRLLAILCFRP